MYFIYPLWNDSAIAEQSPCGQIDGIVLRRALYELARLTVYHVQVLPAGKTQDKSFINPNDFVLIPKCRY